MGTPCVVVVFQAVIFNLFVTVPVNEEEIRFSTP